MYRYPFAKNLDVFLHNSEVFLKMLMIIFKSRCQSKIIHGHAVFQLLPESIFFLETLFALK